MLTHEDTTTLADEDLLFCELEKSWQFSLPRMSEIEWIKLFPEAKDILPSEIERWKQKRKTQFKIGEQLIKDCTPETMVEARFRAQVFVVPQLKEAETNIKRLNRQLSHIEKPSMPRNSSITDTDIQKAKEVPIESLLSGKFRKTGKNLMAKCPLHDDNSPSFMIYRETNTCWCFGCQRGGDSISLTQMLQKLSFVEAVKYLN